MITLSSVFLIRWFGIRYFCSKILKLIVTFGYTDLFLIKKSCLFYNFEIVNVFSYLLLNFKLKIHFCVEVNSQKQQNSQTYFKKYIQYFEIKLNLTLV